MCASFFSIKGYPDSPVSSLPRLQHVGACQHPSPTDFRVNAFFIPSVSCFQAKSNPEPKSPGLVLENQPGPDRMGRRRSILKACNAWMAVLNAGLHLLSALADGAHSSESKACLFVFCKSGTQVQEAKGTGLSFCNC